MHKSADQELYDAVFKRSQVLGYATFDYLPPETTPYPFIHIGEVLIAPKPTKTVWLGEASITINAWGGITNRNIISVMLNTLLRDLTNLKTDGYQYTIRPRDAQIRVLQDNSTGESLWHGILTIYFDFI